MGRVPLGRTCVAVCAGAVLAGVCLTGAAFARQAPDPSGSGRTIVASLVEDATTALGQTPSSRARPPSLVHGRVVPPSFDAVPQIAVLLLTLVALAVAASAGARAPGRCAARVAPSRAPPRVAVVRG